MKWYENLSSPGFKFANQKEKVVVEKVDSEYTDDVIAKLDHN